MKLFLLYAVCRTYDARHSSDVTTYVVGLFDSDHLEQAKEEWRSKQSDLTNILFKEFKAEELELNKVDALNLNFIGDYHGTYTKEKYFRKST